MNKKTIKYIVEYLVIALIVGLTYYMYLPAINLQNEGFWMFLSYAIFLCTLPFSLTVTLKYKKCYAKKTQAQKKLKNADVHLKLKRISFLALIPVAVMCVCLLISSTLFNARAYASVITVNQSIFEDDMPKTTSVTNIALMDTASAQKLGDKKLGSLEEFVSQYTVSDIAPVFDALSNQAQIFPLYGREYFSSPQFPMPFFPSEAFYTSSPQQFYSSLLNILRGTFYCIPLPKKSLPLQSPC